MIEDSSSDDEFGVSKRKPGHPKLEDAVSQASVTISVHSDPVPSASADSFASAGRVSRTNSVRTNSTVSARPPSPTPSTTSDSKEKDDQEKLLKEEEDRKTRLQLYVLVSRCIAYPFNAKQPTDMARRQAKVTKQQLQQIKERFQAFLSGETNIAADEAFTNAVRSYFEVFLKSDRVAKMVQSGGCSCADFRDVFKNNIEKRVRSLPEIDGLSKETVLSSWMAKFDAIYSGDDEQRKGPASPRLGSSTGGTSEVILSKEQLFEMFQNIFGVKKFEHQLIFNAAQLDNADEQAATIRRELDGRRKLAESYQRQQKRLPLKFVVREMESLYIEELRQSINLLMANLESLPVSKGGAESKYSIQKLKKSPRRASNNKLELQESEMTLSKMDIVLSFTLEIVVMEIQGLRSLPASKIVYCTMEVEGGQKLQTDQAEAGKPIWDTQGDFTTNQPLPVVKIKLYVESSRMLSLDDKELGKIILRPTVNTTRVPEWHLMQKTTKSFPDELKIRIAIRTEKPQNVKMCGYIYIMGKTTWKKWKLRYIILVQVSQYTFALCSYREKKADPTEMMQLDGFTVDYVDPDSALEGGRCFFNAVREGDSVMMASEDENDRNLWVQALYRATGQSHKPIPPTTSVVKKGAAPPAHTAQVSRDVDRAKKHGIDELIQADPSGMDHQVVFKQLQMWTLEYRLNDAFSSLGWFSPGQIFVMDEYCARYGVRGCWRHLCYLSDLLDRAEAGTMVDPTLLHYSYAFCASHVHGNRPDGIGTISTDEKNKFDEVKERLCALLENEITHFRYCFPFGRPEGALKATLALLERVLMKDIATPAPPQEIRAAMRKCLENAALVNYTRISQYARIEENFNDAVPPEKKIDALIHLAELCIDLLQQNEEHHAEEFKAAFPWFGELLVEHEEIFWSLFTVDVDHVLETQPADNWDSFPLFQLLNDYLRPHAKLRNGKFHSHLRDLFAPQVVRYVDLMESSIGQSIHKGFERENWKIVGRGCASSEDMLWKLDALQSFIRDLHWPDTVFAEHLEHRLKQMASDMIEACSTRVSKHFDTWMKKGGLMGGTGTDYIISSECCVMINVVIDCKNQALKLCAMESGDLHKYHTKIDDFLERVLAAMRQSLIQKMLGALEAVLKKLARYDEGSFFSSLLSLAKPVNENGQSYVNFVRANSEQLRLKISDELLALTIFEEWYTAQMNLLCNWLSGRAEISLHTYQLSCLLFINKKVVGDFEMQGVTEKILHSKAYQTVANRLTVEEATHACQGKLPNGPAE